MLYRLTGFVVILVLSLAAAGGAAAASDSGQVRQRLAEASFVSTDPSGIVTQAWLYAADEQSPGRVSTVLLRVSRWDPACAPPGEPGPKALGEGDRPGCYTFCGEGYAALPPDAFAVDAHQLDGAALTALVPVYDHVSGTYAQVAVSIAWAATGAPIRLQENQLYHGPLPGETATRHVHAVTRAAAASGTVLLGGEETVLERPTSAWIVAAQEIVT